jgi:hypothetical protein
LEAPAGRVRWAFVQKKSPPENPTGFRDKEL